MRTTKLAFAMIAAVFIAGCAGTGETTAADEDCFRISQVRNWDAIDTKHIYIESISKDDRYLLTMFGPCPGIRFTQAIALSNPTGRVCPSDFGKITYRDSGRALASCRIDDIERVGNKDEARAIVELRKQEE